MGQDNIIKDKSFDFAVKIVKVYKFSEKKRICVIKTVIEGGY